MSVEEHQNNLFKQAMNDVGKLHGIDLYSDPHGYYTLQLENKYNTVVHLNHENRMMVMVAFVGDLKYVINASLFEFLLTCNYDSKKINGCTIGLCKTTGRYTLKNAVPAVELNPSVLNNILQNFGLVLKEMEDNIVQLNGQYNEITSAESNTKDIVSDLDIARFKA